MSRSKPGTCPVCDRPPAAWSPARVRTEPSRVDCAICGTPIDDGVSGIFQNLDGGFYGHTRCHRKEQAERALAAAAAAEPSACWGGAECGAHAHDWRAEALRSRERVAALEARMPVVCPRCKGRGRREAVWMTMTASPAEGVVHGPGWDAEDPCAGCDGRGATWEDPAPGAAGEGESDK